MRLRALVPALLLVLAAGVSGCGGDAEDEADGGPLVVNEPQNEALIDAQELCEEFRPPESPDATVTLVQPSTVDGVRRAAEAFGTPVPDGLDGLDPDAAVARCSYTVAAGPSSPDQAPTTTCPDGQVVVLGAPGVLQYLVLEDGTGIEEQAAATQPATAPC